MNKHPSTYTRDDICGLEERLLRFAATGAEGSELAQEAASLLCNLSVRLGQISLLLKGLR